MTENYIEHIYIDFISETLSERELLEQLAEESSELSQAALKLIRAAKYNDNPTPTKEKEAIENLVEEYGDVLAVWKVIKESISKVDMEENRQAMYRKPEKKLRRWSERLGLKEDKVILCRT